jgi:hypothetical protein
MITIEDGIHGERLFECQSTDEAVAKLRQQVHAALARIHDVE